MKESMSGTVRVERQFMPSAILEREVKLDCFLPIHSSAEEEQCLLLVNDGQDMQALGLKEILENLYQQQAIRSLVVIAIHAGPARKHEYGTAHRVDYKGLGSKASQYTNFVLTELLPFVKETYRLKRVREKAFAGFSLGGLSALDIVWNHPEEFTKVGVFSASLWWRTRALEAGYEEAIDRIMHAQIREGRYHPRLRFFFECGTNDEVMDRNNNGIIDSIDDTVDLIHELEQKGYRLGRDICYLLLEEGRHDVATWARAMPVFLKWGWGNEDTMILK